MSSSTADRELIRSFANIVDSLVTGYDLVELLQILVDASLNIDGVVASGILLADRDGTLDVVASSSEETRLVEAMQLSALAGPCIDCFRTGEVVTLVDTALGPDRWSAFQRRAGELGYRAVVAVPLRVRDQIIGSLNLFLSEPGELEDDDLMTAHALANVATVGLLHERALNERDAVNEQLQRALNSRVVIEQAKGVLAHGLDMSPDDAFPLLRAYARNHSMKLAEVARRVIRLELTITRDESR